MGCVNSRTDINDLHPNLFQVINVDDHGRVISVGRLEITDTELVLHQKRKQPTRWPLRCLRKYGFDSEIFSFECGRRCPTGAGIYAFRCRRAELLFNMVQQSIQSRNLNDDNHINSINDFSVLPIASTGPPVQRRFSGQPESYLNPTPAPSVRSNPTLSRPGSITSNGPCSPPVISPLPVDIERNNNSKRNSIPLEHSYTNTSAILEETLHSPSYINITPTLPLVPENYVNIPENNGHLYMNINCDNPLTPVDITKEIDIEDTMHCYANIDVSDLENLKPSSSIMEFSSVPQTPTSLCSAFRDVNYAELDLVPGKTPGGNVAVPESPTHLKKSYVTIDFHKTNALLQSVNPRMDVEEKGSRKTRHNSTINDMPNRHSNSISD